MFADYSRFSNLQKTTELSFQDVLDEDDISSVISWFPTILSCSICLGVVIGLLYRSMWVAISIWLYHGLTDKMRHYIRSCGPSFVRLLRKKTSHLWTWRHCQRFIWLRIIKWFQVVAVGKSTYVCTCMYIYIYIIDTFTYTNTHIHTNIASHHITSHHITVHYITLHYITLHYITVHYSTLQYITVHYSTLQYITSWYITLHYSTLPYLTLTLP